MEKEKISPKENLSLVYEAIDQDPEINQLLGKILDEERGPEGELIWPSNMIKEENGIIKISGEEFDKNLEEIKKIAQEDQDHERLQKLAEIAQKKSQLISLIKKNCKSRGIK